MRRKGIALLAALALMTLFGLLVVGAVAASMLAQRSSRLLHTDALLTAAADYALNTVIADARGFGLADLPFGQSRTFDVPVPDAAGAKVELSVTRLRAGVLWLVADATLAGLDEGERRINLVARFPSLGGGPGAALESRGRVSLGQNVLFTADTSHEGDCSDPLAPDIMVAPGLEVVGADSMKVVHQQSAMDSASYFLTARQLGVLDGGANVVHVRGDTLIAGGTLDGILIVDGALTIAGPFSASGLVVARGRIDARAGGFTLSGSLMSFATPPIAVSAVDLAGTFVRFAPCVVARALRAAGPPRPVHQRSWAELF